MMVAIAIKALVRMMVIVTMVDGKRAIQVSKHAAELLYEASLHLSRYSATNTSRTVTGAVKNT